MSVSDWADVVRCSFVMPTPTREGRAYFKTTSHTRPDGRQPVVDDTVGPCGYTITYEDCGYAIISASAYHPHPRLRHSCLFACGGT
jgi:hypothetical protein